MNYIKEAFQKVKEDIDFLKQKISNLDDNLLKIQEKIGEFEESIKEINRLGKASNQEKLGSFPTHNPQKTTPLNLFPTQNWFFKAPEHQILDISTRNQGVPTNRQTDKQTNRQINKEEENNLQEENIIENATEILNSLDNIKKEIRIKFKRLTEQEFLVFSTIYQLDEERGYSDYKSISKKLNLTESSIRDYVGKLIKKGIPVEKKKINNKNIQLSLSANLKKVATLPTILQLRDL